MLNAESQSARAELLAMIIILLILVKRVVPMPRQ